MSASKPKYTIPKATIFRPYSKPGAGSPATGGSSGGGSSGSSRGRSTPSRGTAYYDSARGGVVTSDGKFYPTSNPNYTPSGYTRTSTPTSTPATQPKQTQTSTIQPKQIEQTTTQRFQLLGVTSPTLAAQARGMPSPYSPQQRQFEFTTAWKREQEAKVKIAKEKAKESEMYAGIAVDSFRNMGYSTAETANILMGKTQITEEQYKAVEPIITRQTQASKQTQDIIKDKQTQLYLSGTVQAIAPTAVVVSKDLSFTQKMGRNIADWNKALSTDKIFYDPISQKVPIGVNYYPYVSKALGKGSDFLSSKRDDATGISRKAYNIGIGATDFIAEKPATAIIYTTSAAAVAATFSIGGAVAGSYFVAKGVAPAVVAKSGAITGAALKTSGLTFFGLSSAAQGADIRDSDLRYQFYGEQGAKLGTIIAGGQAFKMSDAAIKSNIMKTTAKTEVTGIKTDTRRISLGDEQATDLTRFQGIINVKLGKTPVDKYTFKGLGSERIIKQPNNIFNLKGTQKTILTDAKGTELGKFSTKTVGTAKFENDISKALRFAKTTGSKDLQQNIIASADKVSTSDGLLRSTGVYENVAGKTVFKTQSFGRTALKQDFEISKIAPNTGEQVTYRSYKGAGMDVKDKTYIDSFIRKSGKVMEFDGKKSNFKTLKQVSNSKTQQDFIKRFEQPTKTISTSKITISKIKPFQNVAGLSTAKAAAITTSIKTSQIPTSGLSSLFGSVFATTQQQRQRSSLASALRTGQKQSLGSEIASVLKWDISNISKIGIKTDTTIATQLKKDTALTPVTKSTYKTLMQYPSFMGGFNLPSPLTLAPPLVLLPPIISFSTGYRKTGIGYTKIKKKQDKAYKPTLRAVGLGLAKKGTKIEGLLTGLEERY